MMEVCSCHYTIEGIRCSAVLATLHKDIKSGLMLRGITDLPGLRNFLDNTWWHNCPGYLYRPIVTKVLDIIDEEVAKKAKKRRN